ncbi:unnamed protein product [marine sediment metagenome]|uniref:Uncharacterized protein n=1 Tax=marine sediment metagenome TaxID=412755 RepID=X1CA48_9ZZZZ
MLGLQQPTIPRKEGGYYAKRNGTKHGGTQHSATIGNPGDDQETSTMAMG